MATHPAEFEALIDAQFSRIGALVGFMVQSELGDVYQGSLDAASLRGVQDDLLTDDARALTDMLRENQRDVRAKENFGVESYGQLTPGQRLLDVIFHAPVYPSDSENRVLTATVDLQDNIGTAVSNSEESLPEVELYSKGIEFTDTVTNRVYSVNDDTVDEPAISVEIKDLSEGEEAPFRTLRAADKAAALERIHWVLNAVEDHTLALLIAPESF